MVETGSARILEPWLWRSVEVEFLILTKTGSARLDFVSQLCGLIGFDWTKTLMIASPCQDCVALCRRTSPRVSGGSSHAIPAVPALARKSQCRPERFDN
jgi:hypothetical protein